MSVTCYYTFTKWWQYLNCSIVFNICSIYSYNTFNTCSTSSFRYDCSIVFPFSSLIKIHSYTVVSYKVDCSIVFSYWVCTYCEHSDTVMFLNVYDTSIYYVSFFFSSSTVCTYSRDIVSCSHRSWIFFVYEVRCSCSYSSEVCRRYVIVCRVDSHVSVSFYTSFCVTVSKSTVCKKIYITS